MGILCNSKVPKNNPRLLHSRDCTGIAQNGKLHDKTGQNVHNTTRTAKARAIQIQNQSHNMSLCSWRHFSICTDRKLYASPLCTIQQQKSICYIYVALSTYLPFYAQQQEVKKKCNIHRPTPFIHRFIFNKFFRFYSPCHQCLCLY